VSRKPEEMILALLGECILARNERAVAAGVYIDILEACGSAPGTTRTTLQRMRTRGLFHTHRAGRESLYEPTRSFLRILDEASTRVLAKDPFTAEGSGWTVVTFSLPETQRSVRHVVRSQLTWAGFGDLRDGVWVAPGHAEIPDSVRELALDESLRVAVFRAQEIEGLPLAKTFMSAWNVDELRGAHAQFLDRWEHAPEQSDSPLRDIVWLIADWLSLLRNDPRLPVAHVDDEWPAQRSVQAFTRLHRAWRPRARRQFDAAADHA